MRINKFLSSLGIASRRAIDKYIEEGRIKVNGVIASTGIDVTEDDEIYMDNKKIETKRIEEKVYFMLNKPLEVLSASSDDRGRKTVVDLIKTDKRIFPIGRLDYMTSGLILLTNDGELFNRIVHPKSEIYKKYYVKILGEIKKEEIEELKKGVLLDDSKTLPAKISGIKYDKNNKSYSTYFSKLVEENIIPYGHFVLEENKESEIIGDLVTFEKRNTLITNILKTLSEYNMKGLVLEVKNVQDTRAFIRFVTELKPRLKETGKKLVMPNDNILSDTIRKMVDYTY